ncbi:MAG: DNA polymerase I [Candidatus Marinarcus sp.]|uniref:DNA polymerase I n=1 Tax=Candidatus Marinarcus sp. TaxID=3100987 RepID=UPI003B0089BE
MLQNNENNNKTITVIDTFGFLFRSFYALPPLKSKSGFPTGLLTGFMNFISNIGKDFQTDYIVFALDSKGDTFRNELYSEYKAHRQEVPQDLLTQLPIAISWIEKMGFKTASRVGFEADDIVASIAHDAREKGLIVRIVSHDKDLYQLIDDNKIFLFDPIKKEIVNEEKCITKYGVKPIQFIDYQALIGDSADNIPGVKGVGAKTAQALLEQYETLDNIYANLENIEKPRWAKLLDENKEMAYLSKKLVTLKTDSHCIEVLEEFLLPRENPILKIENTLLEYDLNKIIERVHQNGLNYKTHMPSQTQPVVVEKKESAFESILVQNAEEMFKIIDSILPDDIVAFDTETTSVDAKKASIVGFSFCFNDTKAYYVPIGHFYLGVGEQISKENAKEAILKLNAHKLVLQNFKYDSQIIKHNFDIELKLYADTMILAWLLNSDEKVGLDYLADKYFSHTMIGFNDVVKKGENFSNVDLEKASQYAAEDAYMTYKLYYKLLDEFKKNGCEHLLEIAKNVEFDFIHVLTYMQENGIKVNTALFKELKESNIKYLQNLTSKIYEEAGSEFNINSTKQLGVILFEHLNLPPTKKTKTGYSTNEAVLSKLVDKHPLIPLLLEYREAYKLQSTYIEPLLELALKDKENKIYTSFLQTGTATGRLSSKNPNLQNIPVKSEAGKAIRNGFIASENKILIGIDYSQIELRLLAHFSKDKALVEAFQKGLDIHMQTAIKIFGEEEAASKRNIAKSINFGLLYGMGSKKLGETLGIASTEAKKYIESYFEAFSSVKEYLKSIEDFALEHGFVETLLKRRRNFDFNSAGGMQRAMYLREAVNTLFQGSAADLIKLSMIEIYKKYKDNSDLKMLLQIHDELIFEATESKADEFAQDLKNIMINVYKLGIPLEVSLSLSKSWGTLK